MGKKKGTVTIYDVAREAKVSMATVSRVVNGNPNVKPSTRKRVLETIQQLGYRPNAVARGLASKRTTTVGVVIPDVSSPFYAELTRGIEDIATMYHYHIILCNSDRKKEKELQLVETLLEKQVDGLLFLGGEVTTEHQKMFTESPVPVVLAATRDSEEKSPSVTIDQRQAAYDATSMLIQLGYQQIGLIVDSLTDMVFGYPRYQGYKDALTRAGIPLREDWIRVGEGNYGSGLEAMNCLLDIEEPPKAIFAAGDQMAVGALHALQDRGKSVPHDMAVFGFGDIPLASQVRPLLSTVSVPMYDIGAVAMRFLTKFINKEPIESSQVILEHRLVLRDSTPKQGD